MSKYSEEYYFDVSFYRFVSGLFILSVHILKVIIEKNEIRFTSSIVPLIPEKKNILEITNDYTPLTGMLLLSRHTVRRLTFSMYMFLSFNAHF